MYVPRARYSLTMSFWVVPCSAERGTPCSSASATYSASSHIAVALIVIDVFIRSSGMPSNSTRMSSSELTGTPTLPTSGTGDRVVGGVAALGRQVERDREAGLAARQVLAEQPVRRLDGRVAGVRAEDPGPVRLLEPRHARPQSLTPRPGSAAPTSTTIFPRWAFSRIIWCGTGHSPNGNVRISTGITLRSMISWFARVAW